MLPVGFRERQRAEILISDNLGNCPQMLGSINLFWTLESYSKNNIALPLLTILLIKGKKNEHLKASTFL